MLNRTSNPYLVVSVFTVANLYFYLQNNHSSDAKCEGESEERLDLLFSKLRDAGIVL